MADFLMILGRLLYFLLSWVVAILIWKTVALCDEKPEASPVLAWDVLALCCMLIFLVVKLVFV